MPSFSSADRIGLDYHILDASNNRISYLTSSSFANAPFTKVILSNNELNSSTTSIPDNAFNGDEKSIFELDLSSNHLTSLPLALTHLSNITMLDVTDNPIAYSTDFTYRAMKAMGDSMRDFRFGSQQLEEWPKTLNHFQQLQKLEVDGISSRLQVVPPEGFRGFETTLLELNIHHTSLIGVPIGISKLRNLQTLHFDDNPYVKNRGVLVQSFPIFGTSHKLRELTLNNDGLTKFPEVIKYLRGLQSLSLDENILDFVSDANLLGNITINSLTLRNCKLSRVPGALSDLQLPNYP
ncbi:hypothetical protein FSP39_022183 [Pinctada imbricata]|uniref:Uncharacterized protein n=1 Tax=Pinctada imbricata TaxID=66713 RepID=A0AA89C5Z4_PINIB|nr:hypothetical protein FSP39_022183 [Pinctada imbricata]